MQTFTTKGATDFLYADDFRSNGCPDVWCLQNESGTIELEALTEETSDWVGASWTAESSPPRASLAGASEFNLSQLLTLSRSSSIPTSLQTRS